MNVIQLCYIYITYLNLQFNFAFLFIFMSSYITMCKYTCAKTYYLIFLTFLILI
jgi:hypothetical protein